MLLAEIIIADKMNEPTTDWHPPLALTKSNPGLEGRIMADSQHMPTSTDGQQVQYRDIAGFPGYRVGDDGSVWSCRVRSGRNSSTVGTNWKRLKPNQCPYYPLVALCDGSGKAFTRAVHLLVLECFVGPRPSGMVAAHCNGDRRDSRAANLRWDTQKANIADKRIHGTHLQGTQLPWTRLSESDVREIRTLLGSMSLRKIAARFGVTRHQIANIRDGKSWGWLT